MWQLVSMISKFIQDYTTARKYDFKTAYVGHMCLCVCVCVSAFCCSGPLTCTFCFVLFCFILELCVSEVTRLIGSGVVLKRSVSYHLKCALWCRGCCCKHCWEPRQVGWWLHCPVPWSPHPGGGELPGAVERVAVPHSQRQSMLSIAVANDDVTFPRKSLWLDWCWSFVLILAKDWGIFLSWAISGCMLWSNDELCLIPASPH